MLNKYTVSINDIIKSNRCIIQNNIYPLIYDGAIPEIRKCGCEKNFWKNHKKKEYNPTILYNKFFNAENITIGILVFNNGAALLYQYVSGKLRNRYILSLQAYKDMIVYFNKIIAKKEIRSYSSCEVIKNDDLLCFNTKYGIDTDILTIPEFNELSVLIAEIHRKENIIRKQMKAAKETCKMLDVDFSNVLYYRNKYGCSFTHAILLAMH